MNTQIKQLFLSMMITTAAIVLPCQAAEEKHEEHTPDSNLQQQMNQALQTFFDSLGETKARQLQEKKNSQEQQPLEKEDAYGTPLPPPLEPTLSMRSAIKCRDGTGTMAAYVRGTSQRIEKGIHEQYQREIQYYQRREKLFFKIYDLGSAPFYPLSESDPDDDKWEYLTETRTSPFSNSIYREMWWKFCETSNNIHLQIPDHIYYLPVMRSKQLTVTYGDYEATSKATNNRLTKQHYEDVGKVIKLDYYDSFAIHPMYGFEPDDFSTIDGLADTLATLPQTQWALKEFAIPHFIGLKNLELLLEGIALNKTIKTLDFNGVYGAQSVALMGKMFSQNKCIQTLHMGLNNYLDFMCLNKLGKGLTSNKSLTTFLLTINAPLDDASLILRFPHLKQQYIKPIPEEENAEPIDPLNPYAEFVQGIEHCKIHRIKITWVNSLGYSGAAPLEFTQLQQAFMKFSEGRFKNPLYPEYQETPEDNGNHVIFEADNWKTQ